MNQDVITVLFYHESNDNDSLLVVYYSSFLPYQVGQTIWLEAGTLKLQPFEIVNIEHSIKKELLRSGNISTMTKMEVVVKEKRQ